MFEKPNQPAAPLDDGPDEERADLEGGEGEPTAAELVETRRSVERVSAMFERVAGRLGRVFGKWRGEGGPDRGKKMRNTIAASMALAGAIVAAMPEKAEAGQSVGGDPVIEQHLEELEAAAGSLQERMASFLDAVGVEPEPDIEPPSETPVDELENQLSKAEAALDDISDEGESVTEAESAGAAETVEGGMVGEYEAKTDAGLEALSGIEELGRNTVDTIEQQLAQLQERVADLEKELGKLQSGPQTTDSMLKQERILDQLGKLKGTEFERGQITQIIADGLMEFSAAAKGMLGELDRLQAEANSATQDAILAGNSKLEQEKSEESDNLGKDLQSARDYIERIQYSFSRHVESTVMR